MGGPSGLHLTKRGDVFHITGSLKLLDGSVKRVRRSTGHTNEAFAVVELERVKSELLRGASYSPPPHVVAAIPKTTPKATLGDVVDAYLGKPDAPGDTDRRVVDVLVREFGHKTLLDDISSAAIMRHATSGGVKAGTVKRKLTTITAMFNHAQEIGIEVPEFRLRKPKVDDARDRWLTESERDLFLSCCPEPIVPLTTTLFYTGCRLGEAFNLKPEHVLPDGVLFTTKKGSGRARRVRKVPILPIVGRYLHGASGDWVFTTTTGCQWRQKMFYKYWGDALEASGIENFRPHDCRRTFASHLLQKGTDISVVAKLLGHTSLQMVTRYAYFTPDTVSEAVSKLGGSDTKLTHTPSHAEKVVPQERIELSTSRLPSECSTTELLRPVNRHSNSSDGYGLPPSDLARLVAENLTKGKP